MQIDTHDELYEEFKASVEGDPDAQGANDFSAGSWLDAFAGVAAIAGRAVERFMLRRTKDLFFATASDDALEYLAQDRLGLSKNAGETNEQFRERISDYVKSLIRGTFKAFKFWILQDDARAAGLAIEEDIVDTIVDLVVDPSADVADVAVYLEELRAELDEWRVPGIATNVKEAA